MSPKANLPSRNSAFVWCVALLIASTMLVAISASAQSTSTYTENAAKFLCGVPTSSSVGAFGVENAEYATSINIHNPNLFTTDKPISFLKKVVRAKEEGMTPTAPSAFKQDTLPNDYSEYVDCHVIRAMMPGAPASPAFIEGFVVIVVPPASSPNELDVVGVYTSSNNPPTSLQVVPIAPRIIVPPPTGAATLDGTIQ